MNFVLEGESTDGSSVEYNPWPSFNFTGKLRPFPPGPKRTVPPHIGRPDYADHPTGFPASENAAKGSGQIKVLDDEEIEGMRVACRLGREVLDEAARLVLFIYFWTCIIHSIYILVKNTIDEMKKVM